MRVGNLVLLAALALTIAAPALAAPNPGREWMLERKTGKKAFVPDGPGAADLETGEIRNTSKTLAGDSNKGSQNAKSAGAGKALRLTGATSVTARGGNLSVDLSALAARVAGGAVDFGSPDGKRVFQVSSAGGSDPAIQFQAYSGNALSTTVLIVSGRNPSAARNGAIVSLARVSADGNTLTGVFDGPNGQFGSLRALN
ncbi:MAG: hypothetical protein FJZ01_16700 [Candidatus Sericytochromatia bacterium]|nr:hypothetical protein [Candidatus Tanganyikabacteria bacterium]